MTRLLVLLSLVTLAPLVALPTRAADEGIVLGSVREVRVSGRVFDAKTREPLPGALVTIEAPSGNRRADAGPDGDYLATASAEGGLGTISIAFAHGAYQQKYLETVFRGAFPGRVDLAVSRQGVVVKAKKSDLTLSCGSAGDLQLRSGVAAKLTALCEAETVGVALEIRGNRIAVFAREPFSVRIEDGRLEVRETQASSIDMRVDAAMLTR